MTVERETTAPAPVTHPSAQERAARGKAERAEDPRPSHAALELADERDPVGLLEEQAMSRVPELVPIRYGRMLDSPFAFFRGGAKLMAHDLAQGPRTGLTVQLCGDAHLSNFGGFASPERSLVFDLNDFDETLPGPFEWDLKRLAASFEVAGRERGFSDDERSAIVLALLGGYRESMRTFAQMRNLEVWYARLDADMVAARLRVERGKKRAKRLGRGLEKAYAKDSMRAFAKLTKPVGDELRIISDPPLLVPIRDLVEPDRARDLEEELHVLFRTYRQSLQGDRRKLLEGYRLVDLAHKVVGVGSVGNRAWILLLTGRDDVDPLFLQVKEAQPSVLEPYVGKSRFGNHGRRVVEGQRLMQAASDIFLGWLRNPEGLDGRARDFYVRQLWDWKASVDTDVIDQRGFELYAGMCAWTLARAHARSGDRIAIAAYLGKNDAFDRAVAEFAVAYADLNERDYEALRAAVSEKRITATAGV